MGGIADSGKTNQAAITSICSAMLPPGKSQGTLMNHVFPASADIPQQKISPHPEDRMAIECRNCLKAPEMAISKMPNKKHAGAR
jgi:hypothetical protein